MTLVGRIQSLKVMMSSRLDLDREAWLSDTFGGLGRLQMNAGKIMGLELDVIGYVHDAITRPICAESLTTTTLATIMTRRSHLVKSIERRNYVPNTHVGLNVV